MPQTVLLATLLSISKMEAVYRIAVRPTIWTLRYFSVLAAFLRAIAAQVPQHVFHAEIALIYYIMGNAWRYVLTALTIATRHAKFAPHHVLHAIKPTLHSLSAYNVSARCIWACRNPEYVYQSAKATNMEMPTLENAITAFLLVYHVPMLSVAWVVLITIFDTKLNAWPSPAVQVGAICSIGHASMTVELFGLSIPQQFVRMNVLHLLWNWWQIWKDVFWVAHKTILLTITTPVWNVVGNSVQIFSL